MSSWSGRRPPASVIDRGDERAEPALQGVDGLDMRTRLGALELAVSGLMRRVSAVEKAPSAVRPGEAAVSNPKEEVGRQIERLRGDVDGQTLLRFTARGLRKRLKRDGL